MGKNQVHSAGAPLRMNNEELQFPVTFRLKAFLTTVLPDKENKSRLVHVFDTLKIGYIYHGALRSNKGNYVSYTYEITITDHPTLHRLYELLKEIDNLKFAL